MAPIETLAQPHPAAQNVGMVSKDALDKEIEAKRLELEKARAQIAELEVELRALQRAAALRPPRSAHGASRPQHNAPRRSGRGGRVPGAISKPWREILVRVSKAYPAGATVEDIASFGPAVGLPNLRARDARHQAEKYLAHGFVERVGDRFKVTDSAVERFSAGAPAPRNDPDDRQGKFLSSDPIHEGLSV